MIFKCETINIDGKDKIHTITLVSKKGKNQKNISYVDQTIEGEMADEYGNLLYSLDFNNNIVKDDVVLSYDQSMDNIKAKRRQEYIQTDAMYMEAIYDNDPLKLKKWKEAVSKVKERNKFPVKKEIE